MFSPLIQELIDTLTYLPGIGPKSAQRMAFYLLDGQRRPQGKQLAQALTAALDNVQRCQRCQTYTEQTHCQLCVDPKRKPSHICVVESPADIIAIEQTHSYQGSYFVLHGHLSPLDGIGPQELHIPALLSRIANEPVEEIILATNPTMEGKATAHYIATHLTKPNITLTRIAFGVPLGGEIEYLDGHTLAHAFQSRLPFSQPEHIS